MLQAQNLAARRGDELLFSELSFSVTPGEALLVSGANGSGKTTLLRILAGLTHPADGTVTWRGAPVRVFDSQLRAQSFFFGHASALKDEFTALENLAALARLHGSNPTREQLQRALSTWSLSRQSGLPARVLSQGQRRRVGLARLRLAERVLWLLDEPASALDECGIATLCTAVKEHLARGGLAVIATHQSLDLGSDVAHTLRLA
jgi:heme exporter protein A